ncbi:cysteine hydrolase family protein [Paenibacillus gorillae]|uniref:cysteine hydrolase family protein n=1 Tax=Paenibacillus gorillae TaxID=1243662 RepID=UPI0004B3E617|nr:cysteine hydrolase [Paenibacillus gorillae]
MQLNPQTTALVLTDPQNEFLVPGGAGYELTKEVIKANNTLENMESLLKAAKEMQYPVFVSPHYYYPHDHKWSILSTGEEMMHNMNMFYKNNANEGAAPGSGADFVEVLKPYLEDGETVIASPHKVFGPESNDLVLQLRKRGISKVLLAGMNSNICVESHMRALVEQGFEVAVVHDATAAPGMEAYKAAMVNFSLLCSASWSTAETITNMK